MITVYLVIDSYGWVQEKRAKKFIELEKKFKQIEYKIINYKTFQKKLFQIKKENLIYYIMSWRILDGVDPKQFAPFVNKIIVGVTSHYNLGGIENISKCLTKDISNSLRLNKTFDLLNYFKFVSANSLILFKYLNTKIDSNIFYTPNGVDERKFSLNQNKIKNPIVFGWTGKKKMAKNYELLQEIKKKYSDRINFNYKLYHRKKSFLNNIFFFKNNNDIQSFYKKINFYICTSWHEGTPNPCLEALSCGIPVITTKVGNMPEIIEDGVNGFFIDHSVDSIERVISKISQLSNSDYLIMSSNSRKSIIESWTWNIKYKKIREMIIEVNKRLNNV